jgi:hypothetical protein
MQSNAKQSKTIFAHLKHAKVRLASLARGPDFGLNIKFFLKDFLTPIFSLFSPQISFYFLSTHAVILFIRFSIIWWEGGGQKSENLFMTFKTLLQFF